MVKRTSLEKADCPVARSLDAIGDWWSLLIVRDALDGVRRFSEFQKGLGVSKGILATRLRGLVDLDILETAPASDGSAYHEYVLTEKGRELFPVVVGLRQWGEKHCFDPGEPHSVLVDSQTGGPVDRLELRAKTGRVLTSEDTSVMKIVGPIHARKGSAAPARKRQKASGLRQK
jgi:DNA-binding HxlR family transcriptional regulator